jgi:predicted secreted acid phosphatase
MPRTRLSPRTRALTVSAAALALGLTVYGVGAATADNSVPRSDKQIPNLTDVVNEIKAYYGDTVDSSGEHQASPASNYAKQVAGVEAKAEASIGKSLHKGGHGAAHRKKPAIVLDVDDTSLLTYNYELEVGFNYTTASNQAYLDTKNMPAVFGMDALTNWASAHGVTVFWVTGRPESQRADTVRNLKAVGYTADPDTAHLYLKNTATPPSYLPCGATCSTIEYKSGTRKHIESLGYDIVANVGDQYSDLDGGYADASFKLPNPMYYLP